MSGGMVRQASQESIHMQQEKKKEFLEKEFILREERIKMHILVIGVKY